MDTLDVQGERLLTPNRYECTADFARFKLNVLAAVLLLRTVVDKGYPTPILFLMYDGGVRAEWPVGPQTHDISVDFNTDDIYLHALDLLTDDVEDEQARPDDAVGVERLLATLTRLLQKTTPC